MSLLNYRTISRKVVIFELKIWNPFFAGKGGDRFNKSKELAGRDKSLNKKPALKLRFRTGFFK